MDGIKKKRVILGMSGGVDSSVAAAILKKEGYDVVGVFMKFWKPGNGGQNRCCTLESEKNARKVSKKLNIPFYVFNFEKEFKKIIVDCFLREIKKGITPNPCVICNKEIKFGLFLEKAFKLKADYIATGHYARVKYKGGKYRLLKGKDKNKDQSYFLWKLSQKQLKNILFPIGDYKKNEVRALAKKLNLPSSDSLESMEVCFIPKKIDDFLKKHIGYLPGDIADNKGKKIGKHKGLWFYTIGQRKGIKLPNGPYYVFCKDIKKNILFITKDIKNLFKKEALVENVNWINKTSFPLKVRSKIRYNQKDFSSIVEKHKKEKLIVKFLKPQKAVTPGQSIVFYKGNELIGGGIIKNE